MPHFVVEYSRVVEERTPVERILECLFEAAGRSDVLSLSDAKFRAVPFDHFRLQAPGQTFVHVTVSLLEGRTDDQKEQLSLLLRAGLADLLPGVTSLSIDVRDMNAAAYKKRLLT